MIPSNGFPVSSVSSFLDSLGEKISQIFGDVPVVGFNCPVGVLLCLGNKDGRYSVMDVVFSDDVCFRNRGDYQKQSDTFRQYLRARFVAETSCCGQLFKWAIYKHILAWEDCWGDAKQLVKVLLVTHLSDF